MKPSALICLLWLAPGLVWAAAATDPAAAARAAYDAGNYVQAAEEYRALEGRGFGSAALYYDWGNAEYKAGHLGRAIALYRRAEKLGPWDEDVRFNLDYARKQVKRPEDPNGPLTRWLLSVYRSLPGPTLLAAAWAIYLLLSALAAVLIVRRGQGALWRWLALAATGLFLIAAGWASLRLLDEKQAAIGVIVTNQAEARNGPAADFDVGFKIPEGREVRVLGHEAGWVAVGLAPEGYKGWVKSEDIWEDGE
ncbi:MAG: SH3 domain-containing protein [candidate division FCPU426 bacterium]